MELKETMLQRMREAWPQLKPEEKAVATLLAQATGPITQRQIARKEAFLGSHRKFERHNNMDTTLRCVRQITRDLKVKHHIAIFAGRNGYWIPTTREEVEVELDSFERKARSSAKAYMVTYNEMRKNVEGLRERPDPATLFDLIGDDDADEEES